LGERRNNKPRASRADPGPGIDDASSMESTLPKPPSPSSQQQRRTNYYRSFDRARRAAGAAADRKAKAFCLWLSLSIEHRDPRLAELLRRLALDEYLAKLAQWSGRRRAA
jgi:hypothetical protein